MRAVGLAAVACVALALGGDGGPASRSPDAPLAALSVPFLASVDDTGAAAFHAWTFAGPVVVTRDGAIASRIGAGGWQKASTRAGEPITVVERFVGADARPRAGERSATDVSVLGADASVAAFDSLDLGDAWPGIRVTLRARARSVEKVFVVAPGASPDAIRVDVIGIDALHVGADGRLVATSGGGEIAFSAPVAWQNGWLGRTRVAVAYAVDGTRYGFVVGRYDRARPLVIDPHLDDRGVLAAPRAS
jgi:hypothetical protein